MPSFAKMEVDEKQPIWQSPPILAPLPPAPAEKREEELTTASMRRELRETMAAAVKGAPFRLRPFILQQIVTNEPIAGVLIDFVESNVKFFLDNPFAFHHVLLVLNAATNSFESISELLGSLSARIIKSAIYPQLVGGFLKKFAAIKTASRAAAVKLPSDADSAVEALASLDEKDYQMRTCLISTISKFRPEIVDIGASWEIFSQQVLAVFRDKVNLIDLVETMLMRASSTTVCAVFQVVTDQSCASKTISRKSVLILISHCIQKGYLNSERKERLNFTSLWIVQAVSSLPHEHGFILEALEKWIALAGISVAVSFVDACAKGVTSMGLHDERIACHSFLKLFLSKYPCIQVNLERRKIHVNGVHWKTDEVDTWTTRLLRRVFEPRSFSECLYARDPLLELLATNTLLIRRQLPLIARYMTGLSSRRMGIFREDCVTEAIDFAIKVIRKLLPDIELAEVEHVNGAIGALMEFFEVVPAESRFKAVLWRKIVNLIVDYSIECEGGAIALATSHRLAEFLDNANVPSGDASVAGLVANIRVHLLGPLMDSS